METLDGTRNQEIGRAELMQNLEKHCDEDDYLNKEISQYYLAEGE